MKVVLIPEDQYVIPKELLYCLILTLAIAIQYVATAYAFTFRARTQVFTRKFMEQFKAEHIAAFPGKKHAPEFGYPDSGNGYYGKKLPYADWFKMNNGQRCQLNFLEHLNFIVVGTMIAAFYYPVWALALQCFIFVGRLAYSIGYTVYGPSGRLIGAIIMDLAIFATFGLMVASCFKLMN